MISVVVCTYNGSSRISACLSSLIGQVTPPTFEILVVDNASDDGTEDQVIQQLRSSLFSGHWKVLQEKRVGLVYARLAGLKEAKFDWVLFCDDDNILFPDFLYQCGKILSVNPRIGVLGSQGIPEFFGDKPKWFDRYASSFAVGPQLVGEGKGNQLVFVYGASSIYRKKPILELFKKGFRSVISDRKGNELISGGDVEWCWLMQLLGYKIAYSSKLQFTHQLSASRLTWEYYIRLKRGISASAGLLSAYTYYTSSSFRSFLGFVFNYNFNSIRALLLYLKYRIRWGSHPTRDEDKLSFAILESQMQAFFKQRREAFAHFRQLQRYFGA